MTTDSTQPQVEVGPAPANGQGQSQGHRRRRRRRNKNKSSQPGAPQAQQSQPQTQAPPPQPIQSQPQSQPRQNNSSSQGRKKKKFFKSGSGSGQPQPELGNRLSQPSQGRRKEKQRGPRAFVGPMDHSYRVANGNIADSPQSTIPTQVNGNGNYYSDNYQSKPTQVREDAPTRIFCYIEDLFFQAKIQETSRKLGVKVEFVKPDTDLLGRFADAPEAERPALVVFDLNNLNAKPMSLIPKFKTKLKKATSIIGFLNHLQGDLKMKAMEAGCDTVMPRSAFSQSLPNLLRRYGLEEEEEYYPQPV
jgi:hypothetical protein